MYNEVITGIDICNYTFCNHYIIIIRSMYVCEHEYICVHTYTLDAWGYYYIRVSCRGFGFEHCRRVFIAMRVLITNYNNIYTRIKHSPTPYKL